MKEDIFDEGKEPNEALKKAAEKYKQKKEYDTNDKYIRVWNGRTNYYCNLLFKTILQKPLRPKRNE